MHLQRRSWVAVTSFVNPASAFGEASKARGRRKSFLAIYLATTAIFFFSWHASRFVSLRTKGLCAECDQLCLV